jgi:glyoxylase-like metal-dependent hydrolase (beta-lactamase superfamily II)
MREIGEGFFQLDSPGRTVNVFLVRADETVLVDTGTPRIGSRVVAELREAAVVPTVILLTHSHFDHAGGADVIRAATGAAVVAPAAERPLFSGELRHRFLARAGARVVNLGRPVELPAVDRWLAPGDVVAGLEVVATPGHTPGHVAYRLGTTIVGGDAFMTGEERFREAVPVFVADRAQARRSIEQLTELDLDVAVSGHGPAARGASEKLAALAATWS